MSDNTIIPERSSGILLHISSLPGPFGIGDLGPDAKKFADFLQRTDQRYWQLLPLNPVTPEQGFSPYSSFSAMAGNPLFISPDVLKQEGLLQDSDIDSLQGNSATAPGDADNSKTDFDTAFHIKNELLERAYKNWVDQAGADQEAFKHFCDEQAYWLNDFALYVVLKKQQNQKPWYEWDGPLKKRDQGALRESMEKHPEELIKVKWEQMVFDRQWKALRAYCNERNIRLIGDLPFYMAHDSADVWAHSGNFTLDEEGQLTGIAGVPPDAFSDDGQLWGMPLFNWDTLGNDNFQWWIDRLRRNIEIFDLVRLDHFRAFSAYWSVPANETTARNGQWVPGPGHAFFNAVRDALDGLPFIAEDLGQIDEAVYELRDAFSLPGMNVLHFAFGDDFPRNPYLPHHHTVNSIVYTGTHDNNTTIGWYRELPEHQRKNLSAYIGVAVNETNVSKHLSRLASASIAKLSIIPLQDLLSLDETARMNTPAQGENNWRWRMQADQIMPKAESRLKKWTFSYNRIPG